MKVFILSKSAAEQYVAKDEKALTFVMNVKFIDSQVVSVPVDKEDFDKYEVGKYYDIT